MKNYWIFLLIGKLTISYSSFENIKSNNAAIILSEINSGNNIYFSHNDFNVKIKNILFYETL